MKKIKNKKYSETTKMPLKVKKIKINLKGLFMSFPKGFFDINLTN
jgi:predicted ATPase